MKPTSTPQSDNIRTYCDYVLFYTKLYASKDLASCIYAIQDIDATLKLYPRESRDVYVTKLWIERDAAITRKQKLIDAKLKGAINKKQNNKSKSKNQS